MNVHDKAYELAKSLRECPEAQALKAAKAAVDGEAEASRMLNEFLERQQQLQHQMMSGEEPSPADLEVMNKRYEVLALNPLISRYFDAERRFAVLFDDVNRILGEGLRTVLE
ncbi:YlbF family regulator [Paenibacillus sp. MMS18-CY102]|uniref:YlbF family regulator n=1 Tax=Paenibacillus sp. MMS18-CY102 TaxID=2682849 RepID=UPI001365308C|nr:YlbF family regulator [Paenibacillus sp. MMS18-CY102]MWC26975.1 YlbF family regulator [Paenibacillus sp. MMS18-CY102]